MIPSLPYMRIRLGGVLFSAIGDHGCAVLCVRSGTWWHCGPSHCAAHDASECICGRDPRRGVARDLRGLRSLNRPIQSLPAESFRAGYRVAPEGE